MSVTVLLEWLTIVLLVLLSGLFSGLNLGLMGLDPVDLEVVMSGAEPNASYARQIKPLRAKGNWLLCTLLLGNVAVNAGLSILLADKSDALIGFLLSTVVIVVFGEIIPQAMCSRHALWIGAHTAKMVWLMMAMISVAAYPIALILDRLLGQELGTIYSTPELKKLVDIHAKSAGTKMDARTANIMKGALDLQQTVIRDVMTKIDDVFYLPSDSKLTFDVLTNIFKSGHSRIPIMKKSRLLQTNSTTIVGILYSKDLVLLDPDDEIPVLRVMNAFRYKKPIFLNASTLLDQCLKIFVHSQQHLCMVKEDDDGEKRRRSPRSKSPASAKGRKDYESDEVLLDMQSHDTPNRTSHFDEYLRTYHNQNRGGLHVHSREEEVPPTIIGIVTLEDVIEHALQTELVDEHDVFMDSAHGKLTSRMKRVDWSMLQLFDHRQKVLTSLPPQELQAVYHFLGQSVKVFMPKHRKCTESSIKNLLVSSSVIKIDNLSADGPDGKGKMGRMRDPYAEVEDHGLLLYQRDKKTEYFSLILDGKCEIYAGKQGFRSVLSRWTYLCPDALFQVQQCVLTGKPLMDYVPDFTCKVVENGRVLRIKLSDFKACVQGKFDGENNDFRPTIPPRGFSEPMVMAPNRNEPEAKAEPEKEKENENENEKENENENEKKMDDDAEKDSDKEQIRPYSASSQRNSTSNA